MGKRRGRFGIFAGDRFPVNPTLENHRPCLFKGRHFDQEIIILCVRWYLRFKLSFRDLVEMMAERGISLAQNPSDTNSRISLSLSLERYPPGR